MLDYEAVQNGFAASLAPLTFAIQVTVTDNGQAPITAALANTATYVVYVLDADDPPVFVTSSLAVTLPENALNGAAVSALVTVTDPDVFGGNVAWFNQTFAIAGGNSQGLFGARTTFLVASPAPTQPNSLEIVVASRGPLIAGTSSLQLLNFENAQQSAFALLVTATDGGWKTAPRRRPSGARE